MQRLFGLPGLRIDFLAEDMVRIRKIHGRDEQTMLVFSDGHITVEHANAEDKRFVWYKKNIAEIAKCALQTLGVPFIFEQRHTVSKTLRMTDNADSRPFLASAVARLQKGELTKIGKELGGVGLRFFFPSQDQEGMPSQFDLKIESYLPDSSQIFLLAKGKFLCLPPITQESLQKVSDSLDEVNRVITERALNFLGQFPSREDGS